MTGPIAGIRGRCRGWLYRTGRAIALWIKWHPRWVPGRLWRRTVDRLDAEYEAVAPPPPSHPMCRCEPDRTNPWASNEWQRTLVTPVFVGGPADGHRDEPRPRHALPLRIEMPAMAAKVEAFLDANPGDPHIEQHFAFDSYVYRMGPYVDAFTVEYR